MIWYIGLLVLTAVFIWVLNGCPPFGPRAGNQERRHRVNERCGHENCLGPETAANRGGCRMNTWGDVG